MFLYRIPKFTLTVSFVLRNVVCFILPVNADVDLQGGGEELLS
jgi:hypothetical protein